MSSLFSRRLKIAAIGLLLAVAVVVPTPAKTLEIPVAAAHIDLPGNWTIQNQKDMALYAVSEGSGESVTVTFFSNDNGQGVEAPLFLENMETVMRQRAGTGWRKTAVFSS
jgi:uncharacterized membrane protein YdfJ with MMPL/SSD domain